MSKASPHLGYGKLPYNLPWPALIEGIFNPYNTVQVVETDKDDEVADAETADEDEKVLQTVEAADSWKLLQVKTLKQKLKKEEIKKNIKEIYLILSYENVDPPACRSCWNWRRWRS